MRMLLKAAVLLAAVPGTLWAQTQAVKPVEAQVWIDIATVSGMGGAGASPMGAMMGSMLGGGGGRNSFGNTQSTPPGRWVDVTLASRRNPQLAEGRQQVPAGSGLSPELQLLAPSQARSAGDDDEPVATREVERPKGKLYLYWGCGDAIRPGQPRVLDVATALPAELQKFFSARRATQRGAHAASGRPAWPNERDARLVPPNASLVGEHSFSGQGVPENFKFAIGPQQDLMPAIDLRQTPVAGATRLAWQTIPHARAYFISAMGPRSGADSDMVFWTSSELPEIGTGLIDYQTNAAVDRWLKEKVLLEPTATSCTVPAGIFGEAGMLRMIAYGSELNLAHPPRPADPKQPWVPQWAAKLRVKSVANAMLGMNMEELRGPPRTQPRDAPSPAEAKPEAINPVDILRGILGR